MSWIKHRCPSEQILHQIELNRIIHKNSIDADFLGCRRKEILFRYWIKSLKKRVHKYKSYHDFYHYRAK
jgi:hypothetical protein